MNAIARTTSLLAALFAASMLALGSGCAGAESCADDETCEEDVDCAEEGDCDDDDTDEVDASNEGEAEAEVDEEAKSAVAADFVPMPILERVPELEHRATPRSGSGLTPIGPMRSSDRLVERVPELEHRATPRSGSGLAPIGPMRSSDHRTDELQATRVDICGWGRCSDPKRVISQP